MQDLRSDLRKEIEHLLQRHPSGLTAVQLADRTQAELPLVRSVIGRLRDKLKVKPAKPGNSNTPYKWMTDSAAPSIAKPDRINKMQGTYTCPELKPFTGRPGCNQHEQFGSRIGDVVYHRDNTIEKL